MQNIGVFGTVIYVVLIIGIFYFMGVRPQQKEKKKQKQQKKKKQQQQKKQILLLWETRCSRLRDFTVW